jgi:hypothetical protein
MESFVDSIKERSGTRLKNSFTRSKEPFSSDFNFVGTSPPLVDGLLVAVELECFCRWLFVSEDAGSEEGVFDDEGR